ncbi:unnamed protein product [Hydatigera taeniaeformis]|uniref:CTNNB1 binding N-teminal domain-containing protein n=1 Tax=Hydatigena taeniaeformis TaxID=6205 RepID=A0A0R3XC04_HYDTA|nr:unnamed protein product [Hydatigera taeniaeformis]
MREEPPSLASGMEEPELEVASDEDGELEAYNMDPGELLGKPSFFSLLHFLPFLFSPPPPLPSPHPNGFKCCTPRLATFGPLFSTASSTLYEFHRD